MGHKYIKEEDTFSTSQNGTVPKPTAAEVSANKFLRADGSWANGGGGGGASEFADLDDVSFSNLQNGQIPKYNSTTQKWENANESGGTVTDVTVDGTSVVNGQGVAEITTPEANEISYDNQTSGLTATDVQSAIDEIAQGGGGGGNVDDVEVNGVSVVNAQKVAEITSYKEVTQAQYNALPSSKLSDDVMYCIKDAHGADGYPPLIYSDEEREVGVWRDGKPLYQKTIITTTASAISTDKVVGDATGLNIVNIFQFRCGWVYDNYTGYIYSIYTNEKVQLYTDGDDIIESHSTANANDQQLIYTIQYTKDSDTPGSGTWTTQGGYAHHYSTSEHVVGTWTDGKPLYEKTIPLTFTINSNNILEIDIGSNIIVQNAKGYCSSYTGQYLDLFAHINTAGLNYSLGAWIEIPYLKIRGGTGMYGSYTGDLTIQYTKTTD